MLTGANIWDAHYHLQAATEHALLAGYVEDRRDHHMRQCIASLLKAVAPLGFDLVPRAVEKLEAAE